MTLSTELHKSFLRHVFGIKEFQASEYLSLGLHTATTLSSDAASGESVIYTENSISSGTKLKISINFSNEETAYVGSVSGTGPYKLNLVDSTGEPYSLSHNHYSDEYVEFVPINEDDLLEPADDNYERILIDNNIDNWSKSGTTFSCDVEFDFPEPEFDWGMVTSFPIFSSRISQDITDATFDTSKSLSGSFGYEYKFNSDGTKFYHDNGDGVIFQYELSTAWNFNTFTYNGVNFTTEENWTGKFKFSPDGTKLYSYHSQTDKVYQYDLSIAWDLNTATYNGTNIGITESGVWLRTFMVVENGSRFYIFSDDDGLFLKEYILSTAWDLTTASVGETFECNGGMPDFSPDGTKMYQRSDDYLYQYTFSSPWDVSTLSYNYINYNLSNSSVISFSPDGTKLHAYEYSADNLEQHTLSTAWDIDTASLDTTLSISTEPKISSNGFKLYILDGDVGEISQYTLSTAWDLNTASFDGIIISSGSMDYTDFLFFSDEHRKMYREHDDSIYQYDVGNKESLLYVNDSDWNVKIEKGDDFLIESNDIKIYKQKFYN